MVWIRTDFRFPFTDVSMSRIAPPLSLVLLLLLTGCRKVDTVLNDSFPVDGGEYWEELTLAGKSAGVQRTSLTQEADGERRFQRYESQSRLTVLRHGQRFDVSMTIDSRSRILPAESPEFRSCEMQLSGGVDPIRTRLEVIDDTPPPRLAISGVQGDVSRPWTHGVLGPEAIIDSLRKQPMVSGGIRKLRFFEPSLQRIYDATLTAGKIETISWNGQNWNLLRIAVQNDVFEPESAGEKPTLAPPVTGILWTDAQGRVVQSEMAVPGGQTMRAVRVSKERALANIKEPPQVELGLLGIVPLNQGLFLPHKTPVLRFVVKTASGTPRDRFPTTPFQALVESKTDPSIAQITVWSAVAHKPPTVGNMAYENAKAEPNLADLASGQLVNLQDPRLIEWAATIDTTGLSAWEAAVLLERQVHDAIRKTSFSMAFASSSDVLATRQGDCSEFSVLLAALCRVKGIPARLAMGLVYTPLAGSAEVEPGKNQAQAAMVFHLWNEVLIDGVWRPLDATLGLGGADAARIKIADDNLAGDTLAPLANSILGVVDQITINVDH